MPESDVLPDPEPVYLWPENLPAWELFLSVQTQWRGTGRQREGLDRYGVEGEIRKRRQWFTRRRRMLDAIAIVERAALAGWAEKAQRED